MAPDKHDGRPSRADERREFEKMSGIMFLIMVVGMVLLFVFLWRMQENSVVTDKTLIVEIGGKRVERLFKGAKIHGGHVDYLGASGGVLYTYHADECPDRKEGFRLIGIRTRKWRLKDGKDLMVSVDTNL